VREISERICRGSSAVSLFLNSGSVCYSRRMLINLCRWSLRIWEPVRYRLRDSYCRIEHGIVQQRSNVRSLLPTHVLRISLVYSRSNKCDGDQLLPTQLGSSFQQWRMVQPTQAALRLGRTHFLENWAL
jgi:hypothetical protein